MLFYQDSPTGENCRIDVGSVAAFIGFPDLAPCEFFYFLIWKCLDRKKSPSNEEIIVETHACFGNIQNTSFWMACKRLRSVERRISSWKCIMLTNRNEQPQNNVFFCCLLVIINPPCVVFLLLLRSLVPHQMNWNGAVINSSTLESMWRDSLRHSLWWNGLSVEPLSLSGQNRSTAQSQALRTRRKIVMRAVNRLSSWDACSVLSLLFIPQQRPPIIFCSNTTR